MPDAILTLNAGSSSLKFAVFEIGPGERLTAMVRGVLDGIGSRPHLAARDAAGTDLAHESQPDDQASDSHEALLGWLMQWVGEHLGRGVLVAVGHRVVHGGRDFTGPVRLTADAVADLDRLTPLAPLHQPHSLAPVRSVMALQPDLPQVACFDTAFHHTMPAVATRFALPREYEDDGVRRYGFHGLSYEHIAGQLRATAPQLAAGRVVVAHLGSGASLCAMQGGRSVDTTMGFTALDGLVMGTRCGSLDPGVVLYMLQQKGLSAPEVEQVLYRQSGLLGVSGISGDMRALVASPEPRAREAVELFAYRVARETAALAGSLGGLDGLVFTAGIGEHVPKVRSAVCERLYWLGARIDPAANARHAERIGTPDSRVDVRVIPTDEEAVIAHHTRAVLLAGGNPLTDTA